MKLFEALAGAMCERFECDVGELADREVSLIHAVVGFDEANDDALDALDYVLGFLNDARTRLETAKDAAVQCSPPERLNV